MRSPSVTPTSSISSLRPPCPNPATPPVPPSSPRLFRRLAVIGAVLGVTAFAYLSLRPSAFVGEVNWIPSWLGRWADRHGVLRNAAAFFVFGFFYFACLDRRSLHLLALAAFAVAIEVGQLWLPHRVFDWRDIVASLAGLVCAWLLVQLGHRFGRSCSS